MPEKWVLRQYQSLPLRAKIGMTMTRIIEWYDHFGGDVCVSFSGGKDSTVLAHLVHDFYPDVPLVFANTGLEYPEIQSFARKMGAEFVRPKMRFDEVISTYGYPIISKENAEAIYYARRIRKETEPGLISGGGTATTDRKRSEINGSRIFGGGWNVRVEEQAGDGRTSRTLCQKRDIPEESRPYKRAQFMGTHTSCVWSHQGGVLQPGMTGEEEPSPG